MVLRQFTKLRPKVNNLIVLIVPPLPALLIIFFLLVIKKVLIKLFWTIIGIIQVFGTFVLACLAQDVFVFLKMRNDFLKRQQ